MVPGHSIFSLQIDLLVGGLTMLKIATIRTSLCGVSEQQNFVIGREL